MTERTTDKNAPSDDDAEGWLAIARAKRLKRTQIIARDDFDAALPEEGLLLQEVQVGNSMEHAYEKACKAFERRAAPVSHVDAQAETPRRWTDEAESAFEKWWQDWRQQNGWANTQRMREGARAVYEGIAYSATDSMVEKLVAQGFAAPSSERAPESCKHGVRWPHECGECEQELSQRLAASSTRAPDAYEFQGIFYRDISDEFKSQARPLYYAASARDALTERQKWQAGIEAARLYISGSTFAEKEIPTVNGILSLLKALQENSLWGPSAPTDGTGAG